MADESRRYETDRTLLLRYVLKSLDSKRLRTKDGLGNLDYASIDVPWLLGIIQSSSTVDLTSFGTVNAEADSRAGTNFEREVRGGTVTVEKRDIASIKVPTVKEKPGDKVPVRATESTQPPIPPQPQSDSGRKSKSSEPERNGSMKSGPGILPEPMPDLFSRLQEDRAMSLRSLEIFLEPEQKQIGVYETLLLFLSEEKDNSTDGVDIGTIAGVVENAIRPVMNITKKKHFMYKSILESALAIEKSKNDVIDSKETSPCVLMCRCRWNAAETVSADRFASRDEYMIWRRRQYVLMFNGYLAHSVRQQVPSNDLSLQGRTVPLVQILMSFRTAVEKTLDSEQPDHLELQMYVDSLSGGTNPGTYYTFADVDAFATVLDACVTGSDDSGSGMINKEEKEVLRRFKRWMNLVDGWLDDTCMACTLHSVYAGKREGPTTLTLIRKHVRKTLASVLPTSDRDSATCAYWCQLVCRIWSPMLENLRSGLGNYQKMFFVGEKTRSYRDVTACAKIFVSLLPLFERDHGFRIGSTDRIGCVSEIEIKFPLQSNSPYLKPIAGLLRSANKASCEGIQSVINSTTKDPVTAIQEAKDLFLQALELEWMFFHPCFCLVMPSETALECCVFPLITAFRKGVEGVVLKAEFELTAEVLRLLKELDIINRIIGEVLKPTGGNAVDKAKYMVDLPNICNAMVNQWLTEQQDAMDQCLIRATAVDQWEPIDPGSNILHTNSAVDGLTLLQAVVNYFFNIPTGAKTDTTLISIVNLVNNCAVRYAQLVVDGAMSTMKEETLQPGSVENGKHKSPSPATNVHASGRKRRFSSTRAASKTGTSFGTSGGRPFEMPDPSEGITKMSKQRSSSSLVPEMTKKLQEARDESSKLYMRINSLHFMVREITKISLLVRSKCITEGLSGPKSDGRRFPWSNLFYLGIRSLRGGIAQIRRLLARKLVYVDLRSRLIESTYMPTASLSPLREMLPDLDALLSEICFSLYGPRPRRQILREFWTVVLEAYEDILLDPASRRVFKAEESDLILDDITLLEELFISKKSIYHEDDEAAESSADRGLPEQVVRDNTSHLRQIVTILFPLPTETLVQEFDHLTEQETRSYPGSTRDRERSIVEENNEGEGPRSSSSPNEIERDQPYFNPLSAFNCARVIVHRDDRESREFQARFRFGGKLVGRFKNSKKTGGG